ncbi:hypothetical protein B0T17DRAFT_40499 [Bombardia bombarda]|uniref:Uncharacterized protein n=1 Tax=Bombardia bombarda TaxID=252184 RepID=A0AA39XK57_9PEZI|nr:hypothetical protein B0T17DRAFT_40499 [Bombardia bombarda]
MTNHAHHGSSHHGSSLLQARNNHANVHHQHLHAAHHDARHALHSDSDDDNNHIRSPNQNQILQNRQVVVVQTVSVLQIIDDTGAVVSVSTILSDPVAQSLVENPSARVTADSDSVLALDALPTVSVPLPSVGDGAPSSTAVSVEATDTIILSSSTTLSPLSDQETVTSTPSTISTGFPTLTSVSGGFNSTATAQ